MQEDSDWVGVVLVALLAAVLYAISTLALWALGPAVAMTLLAGRRSSWKLALSLRRGSRAARSWANALSLV